MIYRRPEGTSLNLVFSALFNDRKVEKEKKYEVNKAMSRDIVPNQTRLFAAKVMTTIESWFVPVGENDRLVSTVTGTLS